MSDQINDETHDDDCLMWIPVVNADNEIISFINTQSLERRIIYTPDLQNHIHKDNWIEQYDENNNLIGYENTRSHVVLSISNKDNAQQSNVDTHELRDKTVTISDPFAAIYENSVGGTDMDSITDPTSHSVSSIHHGSSSYTRSIRSYTNSQQQAYSHTSSVYSAVGLMKSQSRSQISIQHDVIRTDNRPGQPSSDIDRDAQILRQSLEFSLAVNHRLHPHTESCAGNTLYYQTTTGQISSLLPDGYVMSKQEYSDREILCGSWNQVPRDTVATINDLFSCIRLAIVAGRLSRKGSTASRVSGDSLRFQRTSSRADIANILARRQSRPTLVSNTSDVVSASNLSNIMENQNESESVATASDMSDIAIRLSSESESVPFRRTLSNRSFSHASVDSVSARDTESMPSGNQIMAHSVERCVNFARNGGQSTGDGDDIPLVLEKLTDSM